jgi:hypothetical protein
MHTVPMDRQSFELRRIALRGPEYLLACGRQVRTDVSVSRAAPIAVHFAPASSLDHVLVALTAWQPSLSFGWLKPRLEPISISVQTTEHATYLNVVPLPHAFDGSRYDLAYVQCDYEWLTGEPPTKRELLSAAQAAHDMAVACKRPARHGWDSSFL